MTNKFTFNPVTGNLNVTSADSGGGGPYVHVTNSTLSTGTGSVKATFTTTVHDVGGAWNNNRFTPDVPGLYYCSSFISWATTSKDGWPRIYKNGVSGLIDGSFGPVRQHGKETANGFIYLNGTTDYVEMYIYSSSSSAWSSVSFMVALLRPD